MTYNWSTFLVDEKIQINYYSFQMIGQETTNLLDYLPTNPYDWQWRTCSDGHIAPAQKPNRSITCNSHSTRLPVWFPDRQSCPFIQYYCASHTCPFRLLSQKLQTYPSVNVWKIYTEPWASRMPVHSCDSHKSTVYPHKLVLAIFHGSLQTCRHSYDSPYPQIVKMINTPVESSCQNTFPLK